jgi:hypothetical protein
VDWSELKSLSKAQRFRSLTKLTQAINSEMDTSFELSDIMNPTVPIVRKILLAYISKLGAAEGERNKAIISHQNEGKENLQQKEALRRWVDT